MQHPAPHAVSLAAISWIIQQLNDGILCGKLSNDLCSVVTGPVVHNDDFSVPSLRVHVGKHLLQAGCQPRALVVSRNDDAVRGYQINSRRFSALGSELTRI